MRLILAMPGNDDLAQKLSEHLAAGPGRCEIRRFPDGESFVRIDSEVKGRDVIIACTLDRPDDKFLALGFLAATARELGAASVGLVAPYLAYMRQDKSFHAGEGVTSVYFGRLLSQQIDWLVTMDPHLHRRASLSEIYSIPTRVTHAGPAIADWIRTNVKSPVIIGPDSESEQWVAAVAKRAGAPFDVLQKVRTGDRSVKVSTPDRGRWPGRTPVLVDDIVSTARTMIAAAGELRAAGYADIVAVGVHALFADNALSDLQDAGVDRVATCNTVVHPSNQIDVTAYITGAVSAMLTAKDGTGGSNAGTAKQMHQRGSEGERHEP